MFRGSEFSQAEFLQTVSGFLGAYYLGLAATNAGAAFYLWKSGRSRTRLRIPWLGASLSTTRIWLLAALFFAVISPIAWSGDPRLMKFLSIPQPVRDAMDAIAAPKWCLGALCLALPAFFCFRSFFVKPMVAWTGCNLALLFMGFSLTDPDFAAIVAEPDNVAIVGMIFSLGYFTWLGARLAVRNDRRMKQGLAPSEEADDEEVLVWPDLVYIELICMVALTALLLLWGVVWKAPLEAPANPAVTPNPSKAPWYFVGLQEMLLYFDPWMAGVVLPGVILFGLMAIPYLDRNKNGNGYYTIAQRKFAYLVFQFGFLVLWIALIVIGTFLRGPNWSCFGPYEAWDVRKVEAASNVSLSEYFWIGLMGRAQPTAPAGAGGLLKAGCILYRELPGVVLLLAYFAIAPLALAAFRFFRNLSAEMGTARYAVMLSMLLIMGLLPIKMACRWAFSLDYFIAIPEYMMNF